MWWVYIFQLPLCLQIKRHLKLQTLPRALPTMLWLWAEPSHTLSIWGTVKWSPTDLNLGLEHSSKSSEWRIDCTKLKLRSQSKLLAKRYMAALRAVLKPMAYQWSWGSCHQMSGRKMGRSDPIRCLNKLHKLLLPPNSLRPSPFVIIFKCPSENPRKFPNETLQHLPQPLLSVVSINIH